MNLNYFKRSGSTPLMYGCAGGHQNVVEFLIENGANVNDNNEVGHTPLMEAAVVGHIGIADILLKHEAVIDTHANESALTLACQNRHLDMVQFLLERDANPEHQNDKMHTPLMETSKQRQVDVARLLIRSGAQVNVLANSFQSPLTLALSGGHVDLARLLIEKGANIEEVNNGGDTPLIAVTKLLCRGANVSAQKNETLETALTPACRGGFTEIANFLIKSGAHIEGGVADGADDQSQSTIHHLSESKDMVKTREPRN